MKRRRKIPILEIFIILFSILLLQGEFGLTSVIKYSYFDYIGKTGINENTPLITSLEELTSIKPERGTTIQIDTSIVSTYADGSVFKIIGLAEIGERVKTTISLTTNDLEKYQTLSTIRDNVRLTILIHTFKISNKVYNLAAFEDEFVPIEGVEVEITGSLLTFRINNTI